MNSDTSESYSYVQCIPMRVTCALRTEDNIFSSSCQFMQFCTYVNMYKSQQPLNCIQGIYPCLRKRDFNPTFCIYNSIYSARRDGCQRTPDNPENANTAGLTSELHAQTNMPTSRPMYRLNTVLTIFRFFYK